tara:strand:+ start:250 stop:450 length:201 start_codon:yes stop_codon:yes gene_type:complete
MYCGTINYYSRVGRMKVYNKKQRFGFGSFWVDWDGIIEVVILGACIGTIVVGSIFGTWALFQTMSL